MRRLETEPGVHQCSQGQAEQRLSYTTETASGLGSRIDANYQHKISGQWEVSLHLSMTLKVVAFLYGLVGFYLTHCTGPRRAELQCFSKGLAEGEGCAEQ